MKKRFIQVHYFVGEDEKEGEKYLKRKSKLFLGQWFSNLSLYKKHLENWSTLFILDLTLSPLSEKYLAGPEKVWVVNLPPPALKRQMKSRLDLFQEIKADVSGFS